MEDNEEYDSNFVNAFNQPTMSQSYTRRSPTPNFNMNKMNEMSFQVKIYGFKEFDYFVRTLLFAFGLTYLKHIENQYYLKNGV